MKSNTGEIEVFLCPEYNNTNTTAHQPQNQLRPYIPQVSLNVNIFKLFNLNIN